MADTGAPYFIPYVEPTDLVREYPAADEAQADAIAAALDAAGGLVAVKSAIFTGVQTDNVAAGGNVAVTDLTITHEVADASNRLIITAVIGIAGNSFGAGNTGIAVHEGTSLIGAGTAAGSRIQLSSGGWGEAVAGVHDRSVANPSTTFVHTPGAGSKTYTVRAVNIKNSTQAVFVNRSESDEDSTDAARGVSSLVISEVKV